MLQVLIVRLGENRETSDTGMRKIVVEREREWGVMEVKRRDDEGW